MTAASRQVAMASRTLRVELLGRGVERDAWDDFAARSPVAHRHQCLWWAEPLRAYGFRIYPLGCWNEDRLIGVAVFRAYAVPFTRRTVMECLDGPIFFEWETAWADDFVAGVVQLAQRANSMAVVIKHCPHEDVHRDLIAALRSAGLEVALRPGPAEAVLPLEGRTMDQLRSGFNHGTRWRINKARKGRLEVRRLTDPTDLARAHAAWIATANRKAFGDVRPWKGIEPVLRRCIHEGLGSVLGSFLDRQLLAAAFVAHIGNAAAWVYGGYMDGAERYNPTHVLQYEAIKESLEKGMAMYNFGELIAENDPEAKGVDQFKLGFGAVERRHLDTIVWKRTPLLHAATEHLRRGTIGRRLEAMLRRRLIRRGDAQTAGR